MASRCKFVYQIANSAEISKQGCEKIVSSVFAAIAKALQDGERIEIRGFGSFKVKEQSARQARNPRTDETVAVPAKKVAAFKQQRDCRAAESHWPAR